MSWINTYAQGDSLRHVLKAQFHGIPVFESLEYIEEFITTDTSFEYKTYEGSTIHDLSRFEIYVSDRADTSNFLGFVSYSDSSHISINGEDGFYNPVFYTSTGYSKRNYRKLVKKYTPFFREARRDKGRIKDIMLRSYGDRYKETYFYLNENDSIPIIIVQWVNIHHTGLGKRTSIRFIPAQ